MHEVTKCKMTPKIKLLFWGSAIKIVISYTNAVGTFQFWNASKTLKKKFSYHGYDVKGHRGVSYKVLITLFSPIICYLNAYF